MINPNDEVEQPCEVCGDMADECSCSYGGTGLRPMPQSELQMRRDRFKYLFETHEAELKRRYEHNPRHCRYCGTAVSYKDACDEGIMFVDCCRPCFDLQSKDEDQGR